MTKLVMRVVVAGALAVPPVVVLTQSAQDPPISARAKQLHDRALVVDAHDDTTQRMLFDKNFDITARHEDGNVDLPRMRDGGLDALFFFDLGAQRRHRSAGG